MKQRFISVDGILNFLDSIDKNFARSSETLRHVYAIDQLKRYCIGTTNCDLGDSAIALIDGTKEIEV